jgi:hypothetical protein
VAAWGFLSGYRHVFGSVRFRKLAKHVQGSFSLEFSCIEAFYYTTHFIHMALLACRLKRNLLAGVHTEVLMLLWLNQTNMSLTELEW